MEPEAITEEEETPPVAVPLGGVDMSVKHHRIGDPPGVDANAPTAPASSGASITGTTVTIVGKDEDDDDTVLELTE